MLPRPARLALLLVLVGLSLIAFAPGAAAHPDKEIASGKIVVPKGETREIPITIHYHRLVGHVRVDSPDGAELKVRLTNPDGSDPALIAGPGDDLKIDSLMPCCEGEGWTGFQVVLKNDGVQDVQADVRLVLVHDGLAVAVEDAETGAAFAAVAAFLIPAGLGAYLLRRPYAGSASPRLWARWAFGLHLAMWLVAAPLSIYGLLRYGGGFVGGMVAATADLPWTGHALLNTHAVITLALVALWAGSVLTWVAAARRSDVRDLKVAALGGGLGVASLVVFVLWILEYGAIVVPVVMALASAAVPLGGAIRHVRRRAKQGAVAGAPVEGPAAAEPAPVMEPIPAGVEPEAGPTT